MPKPAGSGPQLPPMSAEAAAYVLDFLPRCRGIAWKIHATAPHVLDREELHSLAIEGLALAGARWEEYCREHSFEPYGSKAEEFWRVFAARRCHGQIYDWIRSQDHIPRAARARVKAIRDAGEGVGATMEQLCERTGLSKKVIQQSLDAVANSPVPFDVASESMHPMTATAESQAWTRDEIAADLGLNIKQVSAIFETGVTAVHDRLLKLSVDGPEAAPGAPDAR